MGFFSDFKASLMKGDVLSLATAVVIGAAFGKIATAVNDVIMPIIGLITGELILHKNSLLLMEVLMSILKQLKSRCSCDYL
jgi:large conductance mechanosensitive channel